ncbi:MAG TPA: sulfotransferase [Woeseiaceae bacterium]
MASAQSFEQAFRRARELQARGSRVKAERLYRELLARGDQRELVLRGLVDFYMESRRADDAILHLVALTEEVPDSPYYYGRLAGLLDGLGRTEQAIGHYLRLLERQPDLADVHYNLALLYKKEKRWRDAIAAYERALALGIPRPHEVHSNLGVLYSAMRRPDEAADSYERALALEPDYVPALFNLGGLREESGDRERSRVLYERILELEPHHAGALARLVHASRIESGDDPLLTAIDRALAATQNDAAGQEELLFARGKALDDLGRYDEAFAAFASANALGKRRLPPYRPEAVEAAVGRIIDGCDRAWLERVQTDSPHSPIFICGMFRSGSTLIEQILAAHPAITAGGELEFFPWLTARRLGLWPDQALAAPREALQALGQAYTEHVRELFPDAGNVTDKRPDNFLYLGLIRAVFPAARIVCTQRDAADTCLSIWFQQLGGLTYAADLAQIAHYHRQHERLMAHWRELCGDALYAVDYDSLVRDPEPVVRGLLEFLGLPWDERCLDFRDAERPVQTASVWQVREALHARSSGRWRHYAPHLRGIAGPWHDL